MPPRNAVLLVIALVLATPAVAVVPPTSCGGPPDAPDAAQSDLSIAYWSQQEASSTMCAYGYWAEKCGNHAIAHTIFDRCIAAGYVGAMIWKALLLEDGTGIAQDSAAATELMRRAAHSDDREYATLGKLHYATALYLGRGVERDEAAAERWFREAAAEGDADAQAFLDSGTHTADRDQRGRSVAAQRAARDSTGPRLAPVAPASAPAPTPALGLIAALATLLAAGAAARARDGQQGAH
ncbi:hypothetical protein [Denitromonas halophila]|uniref:Sel1 repeat family protein n=1 Tax=Denitromonas halophila TaxID=1629404 RepID=A0A557QVY5_9RHOO|nr:hypothetical protein [Denitromonas halophila]TVO57082.1 hypothetical protein FHP91_10880 [Denitromonas halophila]